MAKEWEIITQLKRIAARWRLMVALFVVAGLIGCNLPQPPPSGIPLRTEQGGGR